MESRKVQTLLNFSRAGVVDETAVLGALESGSLHAYVCDFPTPALIKHPRAIVLPHLGASTEEAEDNCAAMVAEQVRDFLDMAPFVMRSISRKSWFPAMARGFALASLT